MASFIENYQRTTGDEGEASGSEYIFLCPLEGCRGYDRRKFYIDPNRGGWYCHHCNATLPRKDKGGGSWQDWVELIGDESNMDLWLSAYEDNEFEVVEPLPKKEAYKIWTKFFSYCPLLSDHRKIIEGRGIDPELLGAKTADFSALATLHTEFGRDKLIAAGLIATNKDGVDFPTLCIQTGRILIPYYNEKRTRVIYFVGYQPLPIRKNETEEEYQKIKSRWCKVAGPKGYTPIPYGLQQIPKGSPFVVLQEGQIKSAATSQRGIPSVGLQGMGSQHKPTAKEIASRNIGAVIILFDTEVEAETQIDSAAESIARELLIKNIPCFRAYLPLPEGLEKMDTDLFLLNNPVKRLGEVLLASTQNPYVFGEEKINEV